MSSTPSAVPAQGHSCPFAAALDADESSSDHSGGGEDGSTGGSPVPLQELRKCPAFRDAGCPFRNARSAEEVRQELAKVPPSHYDAEGKFFRVIQQLHSVRPGDGAFLLPGGCPVPRGASHRSFRDAMEGLSFAAVMASLAEQEEDENDEKKDGGGGDMPVLRHDAAISPPPPAAPATDASRQKATSSPTLSQSLKVGTAVSHQAAEDVHFVANFVKGRIDRRLYAQLVMMLYHVYKVLEECLDAHAANHFASCHFPRELRRTPSLEEDLDFWFGADHAPDMSPATRDYVNRIHAVARTDPLLLLAHSYTRYLGDLSGGRILARVARRAMNLGGGGGTGTDEPTEGLAFYHFGEIESPKKFKDHYRSALDALVLTPEQIERLVAEANVAFVLNIRLFEELDVMANVPCAAVRPLEEALSSADKDKMKSMSDGAEKCPFANLAKGAPTANSDGHTSMIKSGCPWPFILLHDPVQGCRDWRTWAVAGLALCWVWSLVKP